MDADAQRRAQIIIRKYETQFNGVTWAPLALDIEDAIADAVAQAVKERIPKVCPICTVTPYACPACEDLVARAPQAEEIARLTEQCATHLEDRQRQYNRANDAWAEVARLRAALQAIIDASDGCMGHRNCNHSMDGWRLAREAQRAWEADTPA